MVISNFVVFHTTINHGQMNSAAPFYPMGMEEQERFKLMREHHGLIAKEIGFDRHKIFMAWQADQEHPYIPGTSYTLTKEDVQQYEDLYDYNVWADTVKITPQTPNTVIGFNVSDAPNVIAMNLRTKEATSTFCSGAHINEEVPTMIKKTLGGNEEDIVVSISPFAHILPWCIEEQGQEPSWLSNKEVWKGCIERHENFLFLHQKQALLKQLIKSGIKKENIVVGEDSFYNAATYYSSQRARVLSDSTQDGRFLHGVILLETYLDTQDVFLSSDFKDWIVGEYEQPYIKTYKID